MPLRHGRAWALAVGLVSTALVAGCTTSTKGQGTPVTPASSSPSATSTVPHSTIAFSDCSKLLDVGGAGIPAARLRELSFECGKVSVPLDYNDPTGKTISIQVVKVHDTQQKNRLGSLVINPGGPGASGLSTPLYLAGSISDDVLKRFDLIGYDPRGVGLSNPIQCISDAQKDAVTSLDVDVRTTAGVAAAKALYGPIIQSCHTKYAAGLGDYNTLYAAMDLDKIRAALGEDQLTYLGYSYGTALGFSYAHLYPTKIRTAVLDGAVDPGVNLIDSIGNQTLGFEAAFNQFAADCVTKQSCAAMGQPLAAVTALVNQANINPIKTSDKSDSRTADGGVVMYAVLDALYSQQSWQPLGQAIIDAQHGDAKGVFQLADEYSERNSDGSHSNILDAYITTLCNDQSTLPTDAQIQAAATQWAAQAPLFGVWGANELFECDGWPPSGHPLPPATATGSKPILVIGNTHDPATPYAGAQHLTTALTTGVLLTWQGQGHTAYLSGSTCIDSKVNAYLINGTTPAVGTVCPA
ncbi:MAG: alpha/beta fold hydrolase [Actinobacteria bacterium]|nr:alpha/beta fold hydrolase [Actinomycetota bacterium]